MPLSMRFNMQLIKSLRQERQKQNVQIKRSIQLQS